MNSAMSGRPIAASSAATTVSNGLDDVMVSRSISILRTVMDWRFRRRRYRSDTNGSVYDDCHVIMAAPTLSVNRLFRVETVPPNWGQDCAKLLIWEKTIQSSCEHHGGSPRVWLDGRLQKRYCIRSILRHGGGNI